MPMRKLIFLSKRGSEHQELGLSLLKRNIEVFFLESLPDLKMTLKESPCSIAVLDIDAFPLGNREIKELKSSFPDTSLFCLSGEPFHPEIREAISNHIFACMVKPLDFEELIFWVESVESVKRKTMLPDQNAP
jgi:DNA-binding NtrC family response regulator